MTQRKKEGKEKRKGNCLSWMICAWVLIYKGDREASERYFITYSSQEKEAFHATWRITRFGQEVEAGVRGKHRTMAFTGVSAERQGRTGRTA